MLFSCCRLNDEKKFDGEINILIKRPCWPKASRILFNYYILRSQFLSAHPPIKRPSPQNRSPVCIVLRKSKDSITFL